MKGEVFQSNKDEDGVTDSQYNEGSGTTSAVWPKQRRDLGKLISFQFEDVVTRALQSMKTGVDCRYGSSFDPMLCC